MSRHRPSQRRDDIPSFTCGKISHPTRDGARRHARALCRLGKDRRPGVLEAYWCARCAAWHVGHSAAKGGGRRA